MKYREINVPTYEGVEYSGHYLFWSLKYKTWRHYFGTVNLSSIKTRVQLPRNSIYLLDLV